ncbi:MAG: MFS transporter, partial [Candidatus Anstonellaceae archaeon]
AGALVGPAIAYGLLSYLGSSQESFQAIFYISAIPAFFAVFVIWKFVKEPPARERVQKRVGFWQRLRFLPPFFKRFLAISCFFSLSYFSFAFLIVKASESGLLPQDVLLLYMLFNFSYMLFAVPAGRLADKIGRKKTIAASFFLYALVLLGFAFFSDFWHLAMLFLLYGLFVAADESVNKAYILELVGKRSAGMALGAYSSAVGAVYLPASVLFGAIWSSFGAFVAFLLAALVAASSSIAMHFFSAKSNQTKLFIN